MPKGQLQTMETRKQPRRVQVKEMGTQGCHLSSSLPGLASAVQLSGMLCGALPLLGDEPTRKRAQKGPQSWGKPSHRLNMSTGIARAHNREGAVQRGKAVVKITHDQVRKAVKPINQVKQIEKRGTRKKVYAGNKKLQKTITSRKK